MGGLIVRLAKLLYPSLPLLACAFLCVPHHGSLLAHLLPLPAVRQMRPNSPLLQKLKNQPWNLPSLVIWCPGDLLVFPGSNALWHFATETIPCHVPIHNWPILSPTLRTKIVHFLTLYSK
ncbi:MAG: hypothetical protein NZL93_06640, partial [Chthoniobacterales bacterium]|nr:hypothetical protein [Chthoniobacterales bacterium]